MRSGPPSCPRLPPIPSTCKKLARPDVGDIQASRQGGEVFGGLGGIPCLGELGAVSVVEDVRKSIRMVHASVLPLAPDGCRRRALCLLGFMVRACSRPLADHRPLRQLGQPWPIQPRIDSLDQRTSAPSLTGRGILPMSLKGLTGTERFPVAQSIPRPVPRNLPRSG